MKKTLTLIVLLFASISFANTAGIIWVPIMVGDITIFVPLSSASQPDPEPEPVRLTINDAIINVPDSNFQQCILNEAMNHTPPLEYADEITFLDCNRQGIYGLEGIDNFINLQTLLVGNNHLNNISMLNSLNNLETLHVGSMGVDFNTIETNQLEFTNAIYSNQIDSIKGMTSLKELRVNNHRGGNMLQSHAFDDGFVNLERLWIVSYEYSDYLNPGFPIVENHLLCGATSPIVLGRWPRLDIPNIQIPYVSGTRFNDGSAASMPGTVLNCN